jgi:hypothetical protein
MSMAGILIRCLELLGLGPEHDPLQMVFFKFLNKIFSKRGFLCSIPFQPALNSEMHGNRPNPRFKYSQLNISVPKYVHEIFAWLIMFQGKNRMVAPPGTPKGRGDGRTKNLMIILKILL